MGQKKRGHTQMGPDPACRGCMYLGFLHDHGMERTCDYLLITGHCRPCLPGASCTVRKLVNGRSRRKADR